MLCFVIINSEVEKNAIYYEKTQRAILSKQNNGVKNNNNKKKNKKNNAIYYAKTVDGI